MSESVPEFTIDDFKDCLKFAYINKEYIKLYNIHGFILKQIIFRIRSEANNEVLVQLIFSDAEYFNYVLFRYNKLNPIRDDVIAAKLIYFTKFLEKI